MPASLTVMRFTGLLRVLLDLVRNHGAIRRMPPELLTALEIHIAALGRRVVAVLRAMADGTLRRHIGRRAPPVALARRPPAAFAPPPAVLAHYDLSQFPFLPRGRGWLVLSIQETAASRAHLEHALAGIDLPAVFAAAPQLRRALGPLATMLGVTLPKAALSTAAAAAATPPAAHDPPSAPPPDPPANRPPDPPPAPAWIPWRPAPPFRTT